MNTVAQITMRTGFVLEHKSEEQSGKNQLSAAALRLLFPEAFPSSRYKAMLQIAGVWNVLQSLAWMEGDALKAESPLSVEEVLHSQATPVQPAANLSGTPAAVTAMPQALRLDIEIIKLIESMAPGPLSRAGLVRFAASGPFQPP